MTLFMEYGMPVKLGDFGTFRPTISVKSQKDVKDLGADNVRRRKILFRPGKRFKNMLNDLSISALDGNTKKASEGEGEDDGD
jgi:hypothetical protein